MTVGGNINDPTMRIAFNDADPEDSRSEQLFLLTNSFHHFGRVFTVQKIVSTRHLHSGNTYLTEYEVLAG